MGDKDKILKLIGYIVKRSECCPFEKEWEGGNLEKDCVGLGEAGCYECIARNIDKLD